jgi:hypothetical protein
MTFCIMTFSMFSKRGYLVAVYDVALLGWCVNSGLYYKGFTKIIYNRDDSTIVEPLL